MDQEPNNDINTKLRALLALAALPFKDESAKSRKVEEVLAQCGVRPEEIAVIVGKNEAAVRKALQRAGIHLRHANSARRK